MYHLELALLSMLLSSASSTPRCLQAPDAAGSDGPECSPARDCVGPVPWLELL